MKPDDQKPKTTKTDDVKTDTKTETKSQKTDKYEVVLRHSPFTKKKLVVEAGNKEEALDKFCEENLKRAQDLQRNSKSRRPQHVRDAEDAIKNMDECNLTITKL